MSYHRPSILKRVCAHGEFEGRILRIEVDASDGSKIFSVVYNDDDE
jgi:hypothetical protein